MPITELEAGTTGELLELVLGLSTHEEQSRRLWFRGHYSESWTLTSTLARKSDSPEVMFARERRLVTRFKQTSLPFWPAGYPQTSWEQLFAMQHFGVPTRLLDWSENLFVALYFAAHVGPYSNISADEEGSDPVLWILDPAAWNMGVKQLYDAGEVGILTTDSEHLERYELSDRDDLSRRYGPPLALYGTHNSSRIVAQRGGFTVAGKSLEPLESFAESESVLWKVALTFTRDQMKRDLSALGFSESMIFPDLAGLSRELTASENLNE